MGTYVVGDIHGCYDEWIELKNRIEKLDSEARFIIIGDIVDRGPKVLQMLDWAMKNITPSGKYQMVIGNHEDMKIEWAKQYNRFDETDYSKSMTYTEFSGDGYDFQDILELNECTDEFVLDAIKFFKELPLFIELVVDTKFGTKQKFLISHAAFPDDGLDETGSVFENYIDTKINNVGYNTAREYILWDRNYWGNNWDSNTILIHGHTPTTTRDLRVRWAIPGKIDFRNKDINIDCGAVFHKEGSGNLAAIRLEDLEEFYLFDKEIEYFLGENRPQEYKKEMLYMMEHGRPFCMWEDSEDEED